jgi:glycosyltransferase involved in cell wall biosynthesis
MKILFAIKKMDDASGGAERVAAAVADELAARGHDVTLLSFDRRGEDGESFYAMSPQVRRLRLGIGDADKPTSKQEVWRRIIALRRIVRLHNPDVAVAFMHSMYVPMALAMTGTGIPVIASEHTVPHHYRGRPAQFLLLLLSSFLVRRLTVVSDSARALYPRILRTRTTVIPNPVSPVSGCADPSGSGIILSVGQLIPSKDQSLLIEAFGLLAPRFPGWRLRLAGEGPMRPALEDLRRRHGLDEWIDLPGAVRDIGRVYAQAHIFVMPSRYESFGLATAEAMSWGLPAVGFADCPGTNELIADGRNGILVKARTADGLAAALETLMKNPALRVAYGQAGRQMLQEYEPSQVADLWEGLIRKAAGSL